MRRNIHVHIHTQDADDKDGHWVTINGARVFIGKGGKIEKGPAALVGKSHAEASGSGKKPTKAELKKQAKAEYDSANKGTGGSFYRAALLHEQAGEEDKARSAHALARRYGHDPVNVANKRQVHKDAAATARAQAKRSASSKARELLLEKAELHERMASTPEGELTPDINTIGPRLQAINDLLMYHEGKAQMGEGNDLDQRRAELRDKHPGKSPDELNEMIEAELGGKGGSAQENLSERQAMLRETGSPRYANRRNK